MTVKELLAYKEEDYIVYSAFLSSELGEMLPKRLKASWNEKDLRLEGWNAWCNATLDLEYEENTGLWKIMYLPCFVTKSKDEVNARAKMLIYLIEHGYINLSN